MSNVTWWMIDIVDQLGELGEWIEPKVWQQHPIATAAQDEIKRLRMQLMSAYNQGHNDALEKAALWHDKYVALAQGRNQQLSELHELSARTIRALKEKSNEA